jgi:post-segregation antitoxin (ccd killing protein)
MTLQINLPVAIETALLARAAAEGIDVSTFVTEAVAERLATPEIETVERSHPVRSAQGFAERLQELIDLHPRTGRPVDDSRESIYEGRGE